MGKTIAQKIIASHLISGDMTPGSEVALRIDQIDGQSCRGDALHLGRIEALLREAITVAVVGCHQ